MCRKQVYITIPYSNDSKNISHGLLVSSCTDVPTKNTKSLTPSFLVPGVRRQVMGLDI